MAHADTQNLSPAGQCLMEFRSQIIDTFCERMRQELRGAKNLSKSILVNTMPAFIENLAEVLTPNSPRLIKEGNTNLSEEHGGERARLTSYNPEDLIREYQIFKEIVLNFLEKRVSLSLEDRLTIQLYVDANLREAAMTFALVQADIREQFIATLTHDLRSPIAVIKMAAELVYDELDNRAQSRQLLGRIIDNAKRADTMIRDLLDSTIVRSGGQLELDISECDMLEIAKAVATEFSISHGAKIVVTGKPVKGFWSEEYLRRAAENLCSNALKYGNSHSVINIIVEEANERVLLKVHNEGPPIPLEEQESIFQVFRRAHAAKKGNQKGWGIGLRLVRGVAEAHGGSVIVDSSEARGTTFAIDIPKDARPFQNARHAHFGEPPL